VSRDNAAAPSNSQELIGRDLADCLCSGEPDGEPVIVVAAIVAVQIRGSILGGDEQVQIAFAVEIRVGGASPDDPSIESGAQRGGHIAEAAGARIAEQQRRLAIAHRALHAANFVRRFGRRIKTQIAARRKSFSFMERTDQTQRRPRVVFLLVFVVNRIARIALARGVRVAAHGVKRQRQHRL
jgi:hypothetical protein